MTIRIATVGFLCSVAASVCLCATGRSQANPIPHSDPNDPANFIKPVLHQELLLQDPVNPLNGPTYSDDFGQYGVALSGNTAAVACARDDELGTNSGSVFVYERATNGWQPTARLTAPDGLANDNFGARVALDGDTLVVSAHMFDRLANALGRVYVYKRDSCGGWSLRRTIENPLPPAEGLGSLFGCEIAIEGNVIVVGAVDAGSPGFPSGAFESGQAWAFETTDDWFNYATTVLLPDGLQDGDLYGSGMAIDGGIIVIGAEGLYNDANQGAVYVWEKREGAWENTQEIPPPPFTGDCFGYDLDIDGNTMFIGASCHAGHVFVCKRNLSGVWGTPTELPLTGGPLWEAGFAVDVEGDLALVSVRGFNAGQGVVHVFSEVNGLWVEQNLRMYPPGAPDGQNFGVSVALDGNTVFVGANGRHDPPGSSNAVGAAYVFSVARKVRQTR